jgi:hypothetical protein
MHPHPQNQVHVNTSPYVLYVLAYTERKGLIFFIETRFFERARAGSCEKEWVLYLFFL